MVTEESLEDPKFIDLFPMIKPEGINVMMNSKKYEARDILKLLDQNKIGRITITGPNGVGKSNLLLTLKNKLDSLAIYLPAQHQLILKEGQISLSSGETALAALNDLQSESHDILLLDEWDANLSEENRDKIDEIIDQMSHKRLIVEIRHTRGLKQGK